MKVRRRDFIKTMGAVGVGVAIYNPALEAFAALPADGSGNSLDGQWYPTTCQGCTTWCSVQVFVQNGRAVKVRGNANSKINPGSVCPRGHMIPKQMYDPDRVKVPMKRTNSSKGKGIDPQFVPITWDEALGTIAAKMMELRAADETHKFLWLRGRYSYSRDISYYGLNKIFGSPNAISHSAICAEAEKAGPYFTEHLWDYRDYDLENTKYLVLWGVDPFRSNRQVPRAMSRWAEVRENAKVVAIDPCLTAVAAKANHWLPIKPGEDGALAVAMAHHLLAQGLWSKEFVGDFNDGTNLFVANQIVNESSFTEVHTNGVVKWWNLELKDKTPEWAEDITGISAATIKEVAEGMGENAPNVCIWFGPGPVMNTRGTYTSMAIHVLNGILGSVENVGGTLHFPKVTVGGIPDYEPYEDDIAHNGLSYGKIDQRGYLKFPALKKGKSGGGVVTNNTANGMLAADPYDIKVAIGYWCNHPFSTSQPERWYEALAQLPFFAHITTNASEMTQFADIVLPAAFSTTEKWSYLKTHGNRYSEASIQQPCADRLFDVRADENEIMWMLAEKLAELGFTNLYDYYSTEFVDPETGMTPTNEFEFAEISTKIFTHPAYNADGDWTAFKAKGVASSPKSVYKEHWDDFGTETGKFEFYSESLKHALELHAEKHSTTIDDVLQQCNYEATGEMAFIPHYETPYRWGDKTEYPLDFIDAKSRFNREGRSQNLPWYYQFKQLDPGDDRWDDCIKINPIDATFLGISDGDTVKVSSVTGSLITKAKIWEGIKPGTAAKTFGQGHWAYGRFASADYANATERGGNNNEILPDDYDRLSGSTTRNGGFVGVKIEKI